MRVDSCERRECPPLSFLCSYFSPYFHLKFLISSLSSLIFPKLTLLSPLSTFLSKRFHFPLSSLISSLSTE